MRGLPLRSRIAIKLAMGEPRMRRGMKWLAADTRTRLLLFTLWNTACCTLPRLLHTPHSKTKRIVVVAVVVDERDPWIVLCLPISSPS
jgi:hypothetical protein